MSAQAPRLITVENLGHAHSLRLPNGLRQGAITVVPLPGGSARSFATDVLNALGKRSWARAASAQKNDPERSAMMWLTSARIEHVFVPNAQWMDESQLTFANSLTSTSTVWLLYPERVPRDFPRGFRSDTGSKDALHSAAEMFISSEDSAIRGDWTDYPELPSSGTLEFRAGCAGLLSPDQMRKVDGAMQVGGAVAGEVIARGGGATELELRLEALAGSNWCSISMIHGARLAALHAGMRLSFDRRAWEASRAGAGALASREIEMLLALDDPRLPALYVMMRVGGLTAGDAAKLRVAELASDGSSFRFRRARFIVPPELRSTLRAYLAHYSEGSAEAGPLFTTSTGRRLEASGVRQRIQSFCAKTALPQPRGLQIRRGSPNYLENLRPLRGEVCT